MGIRKRRRPEPDEVILHYQPHAGQEPFHDSNARIRILACGRRWGKDRAAAAELLVRSLALSRKRRGLVPEVHAWVVAPTLKMLRQAWRELDSLCPPPLVRLRREGAEPTMYLEGHEGREIVIEGRTAHRKHDLVSVGLDLLMVTEAARLAPECWYEGLRPCLSSPGRLGRAVLGSTPRGLNWFYEEFRRGQPGSPEHAEGLVESWNVPTAESPLIDPADIEQARRMVPELTFRQEYGAEFIPGGRTVFAGLDAALCDGDMRSPEIGRLYAIGVDLGRFHDATALAVLRRPARADEAARLVHYETLRDMAWKRQIERIIGLLREFPGRCWLDGTGMGQPICEAVRQQVCWVRSLTFTAALKRDLVDGLALAIETGRLAIPHCAATEPLIGEIEAFTFTQVGSGAVRFCAPPGKHDDGVIALALAVHALGRHWGNE